MAPVKPQYNDITHLYDQHVGSVDSVTGKTTARNGYLVGSDIGDFLDRLMKQEGSKVGAIIATSDTLKNTVAPAPFHFGTIKNAVSFISLPANTMYLQNLIKKYEEDPVLAITTATVTTDKTEVVYEIAGNIVTIPMIDFLNKLILDGTITTDVTKGVSFNIVQLEARLRREAERLASLPNAGTESVSGGSGTPFTPPTLDKDPAVLWPVFRHAQSHPNEGAVYIFDGKPFSVHYNTATRRFSYQYQKEDGTRKTREANTAAEAIGKIVDRSKSKHKTALDLGITFDRQKFYKLCSTIKSAGGTGTCTLNGEEIQVNFNKTKKGVDLYSAVFFINKSRIHIKKKSKEALAYEIEQKIGKPKQSPSKPSKPEPDKEKKESKDPGHKKSEDHGEGEHGDEGEKGLEKIVDKIPLVKKLPDAIKKPLINAIKWGTGATIAVEGISVVTGSGVIGLSALGGIFWPVATVAGSISLGTVLYKKLRGGGGTGGHH